MDNNYYAPPQAELEVSPSATGGMRLPPDWGPVEVYKTAWELMQRNLGTWAAVAGIVFGVALVLNLLTQGVSFILNIAASAAGDQGEALAALGALVVGLLSLVSWPINLWLGMGQARMAVSAVRGEPIEVGQLFAGLPWLLSAMGGTLLIGLGTLAGTCLLVVPGAIFAMGMVLFNVVLVDQNPGAIGAMERSWALTDGYKGRIFLTLFVGSLAAMVLTICTCGAGMLAVVAAAPLFSIGSALIYETVLDERPHLRTGA